MRLETSLLSLLKKSAGLGGAMRSFSPSGAAEKDAGFESESMNGAPARRMERLDKAERSMMRQELAEPGVMGPEERDGVVTEGTPYSIDVLLLKKLRGGKPSR
ncbi:MAG: hypothetical protein HY922_04015 [Elusimicrobia bacterium]|nr:hypothetical protein [Elusimicrobiota bacterium]